VPIYIAPTALSRRSPTGTDPAATGHQRPLAGGVGRRRRGKVGWEGRRLLGFRPSRLTGRRRGGEEALAKQPSKATL
jgi:hypothetical protein